MSHNRAIARNHINITIGLNILGPKNVLHYSETALFEFTLFKNLCKGLLEKNYQHKDSLLKTLAFIEDVEISP